jgi:hypothetical protein
MTALLWAVVCWDDSIEGDAPTRATWSGLGCGLFAGLAFGVRVQSFVLFAALFAVALTAPRPRRAPLAAMGGAFLACVAAVSAINAVRFGSANPFSYGSPPPLSPAPSPIEERLAFFAQPAIVGVGLVTAAAVLGARSARAARGALLPLAAGAAVILAVPLLRHEAARILLTMATLLLNASVGSDDWASPVTTLGWMNKALLVSAPFLGLGLVAVGRFVARPAPPLETALAAMVFLLVGFLSLRDPNARGDFSAMGFFSLSPRYLVEVMPILYLLAWSLLGSVRFGARDAIVGAVASAAIAAGLWAWGPGDGSARKVLVLSAAPILLALLVLLATGASSVGPRRLGGRLAAPLIALAHAATLAFVVAEDGRALVGIAAQYDRWGESFLAVAAPRVALVGWWFAKDPIFHLRAAHDVVTVDPAVDDGASLADTLDALVARGRTPYYFGAELERALPHFRGRYVAVPVSSDPIVFRLDVVSP